MKRRPKKVGRKWQDIMIMTGIKGVEGKRKLENREMVAKTRVNNREEDVQKLRIEGIINNFARGRFRARLARN